MGEVNDFSKISVLGEVGVAGELGDVAAKF